MPKDRKYTLQNKEYFYGARTIFKEFYERNIPAVLVGGAAIQTKLSSMLCKGKPLNEAKDLENALRATDDLDIATIATDSQIYDFLNCLDSKYEELIDNNIYKLSLERIGLKRPRIIVERVGNDGHSEALIRLNIENNCHDLDRLPKKYYSTIVESGEDIDLKNSGIEAKIRIAKPEHLIAAKSLRFIDRDQQDIYNLVSTMNENNQKLNWNNLKIIGYNNIDKISQLKTLLRG